MKASRITSLSSAIIAMALLTFSTVGQAAGGNYSSNTDLRPILELIEQGKYESAINRLHDELDADPDNADIMSLLGFSYRKTRNYEDALTFYEWALHAEPDHRGANEYLGELYLETNQIDKAVQQLEKLDNICSNNCKEYSTLKKAVDSYQQTASNS
jgi:tetratricopeptide (TPR) repeat protein